MVSTLNFHYCSCLLEFLPSYDPPGSSEVCPTFVGDDPYSFCRGGYVGEGYQAGVVRHKCVVYVSGEFGGKGE